MTRPQVAQEGDTVSRQLGGRGVRPGVSMVSASPASAEPFLSSKTFAGLWAQDTNLHIALHKSAYGVHSPLTPRKGN